MKGMRLSTVLAAALAVVALGAGTAAATGAFSANPSKPEVRAIRSALHDRDPKNVIFLLGDGMGTQEITATRYYQGVHNSLNVDPDAVHRVRYDLVGEAGRECALPARLRP